MQSLERLSARIASASAVHHEKLAVAIQLIQIKKSTWGFHEISRTVWPDVEEDSAENLPVDIQCCGTYQTWPIPKGCR